MTSNSENILNSEKYTPLIILKNYGNGDKNQMENYSLSETTFNNNENEDISSFCISLGQQKSTLVDSPFIISRNNFMSMGDFRSEKCPPSLFIPEKEDFPIEWSKTAKQMEESSKTLKFSNEKSFTVDKVVPVNIKKDSGVQTYCDNSVNIYSDESVANQNKIDYGKTSLYKANTVTEHSINKSSSSNRGHNCIEKLDHLVKTSEDIQLEIQSIMSELQAVIKTSSITFANKAESLISENTSDEMIFQFNFADILPRNTKGDLFFLSLMKKISFKIFSSSEDYILDIIVSRYFYKQVEAEASTKNMNSGTMRGCFVSLNNSRNQLVQFLNSQPDHKAKDKDVYLKELMDIDFELQSESLDLFVKEVIKFNKIKTDIIVSFIQDSD